MFDERQLPDRAPPSAILRMLMMVSVTTNIEDLLLNQCVYDIILLI